MADDNVVRGGFGSRPKPTQPRGRIRVAPYVSYGKGDQQAIASWLDREDLTPPDANGDQWVRPSLIGVRDRAVCILYGTPGTLMVADNDGA